VHQANAVAFKSNAVQDGFRAMVVRSGRRIINDGEGLVVVDNKRQLPIYYRTSTPTVPNSRQRDAGGVPRVDTRGFQWVQPSVENGGHERTDTNPGLQVNCGIALGWRIVGGRTPTLCPLLYFLSFSSILFLFCLHLLFLFSRNREKYHREREGKRERERDRE
jgi:hypothetical protein